MTSSGTDAPSIGIILCKGKNDLIVEYTLRDSTKPMGVAEYRISSALPEPLRTALPSVAEFAQELPLLSLVKLRIDVEREIRLLLNCAEEEKERPLGLASTLAELQKLGMAPSSIDRFRDALGTMNRAAHGLDVSDDEAAEAGDVATAFMSELRALREAKS
jgi:hypothetical protein